MEYWLSFNNGAEKLRLPVPPSSFEVKVGTNITVLNSNTIGELALIGKDKLRGLSVSAFFPAQDYPFCQYRGFPPPYECVNKIIQWSRTGKPIRLIITQTNVNIAFAIEDFTYGERDGTGDVYFTLSLKEYRFIGVQTVTEVAVQGGSTKTRPIDKTAPKTYVVRSGDTLWSIAKREYGDGSKASQLAQKNGIKNPNNIPIGKKLVL